MKVERECSSAGWYKSLQTRRVVLKRLYLLGLLWSVGGLLTQHNWHSILIYESKKTKLQQPLRVYSWFIDDISSGRWIIGGLVFCDPMNISRLRKIYLRKYIISVLSRNIFWVPEGLTYLWDDFPLFPYRDQMALGVKQALQDLRVPLDPKDQVVCPFKEYLWVVCKHSDRFLLSFLHEL